MPLHVLPHPLGRHLLTRLRDRATPPAEFRSLGHRLSLLLALEATRELRTTPQAVDTPLETTAGSLLAEPLVIVPVLRAGLGMVTPFLELFPDVAVGHLGLERDHTTAVARQYYAKLPPLAGKRVLVLDPMLATGGSAVQALTIVQEHGAVAPGFVCIVAAPEGVAAVSVAHPHVPITAATLDRELNDKKYILPGLGDFGDRLYGT